MWLHFLFRKLCLKFIDDCLPASFVVGQVGLEPTTALSTGFTVRGDTNYTVLTHMVWMERFELPTNCFVDSYSILLSYIHHVLW